jgi:hypothetical protein
MTDVLVDEIRQANIHLRPKFSRPGGGTLVKNPAFCSEANVEYENVVKCGTPTLLFYC